MTKSRKPIEKIDPEKIKRDFDKWKRSMFAELKIVVVKPSVLLPPPNTPVTPK